MQVTHPSHVKQAASRFLYAAKKSEQAKTSKYQVMAARLDMDFVPFSIESFGAFGTKAQDVVKRIVDCVDTGICSWTKKQVRVGLISAVAVSVQKGNAIALRGGMFQS